jgi:hypothetical protein
MNERENKTILSPNTVDRLRARISTTAQLVRFRVFSSGSFRLKDSGSKDQAAEHHQTWRPSAAFSIKNRFRILKTRLAWRITPCDRPDQINDR